MLNISKGVKQYIFVIGITSSAKYPRLFGVIPSMFNITGIIRSLFCGCALNSAIIIKIIKEYSHHLIENTPSIT